MKYFLFGSVLLCTTAVWGWAGDDTLLPAAQQVDTAFSLPARDCQAPQGNAAAQYALGRRYDKGEGVTPNPAEAARWYQRAAVHGHTAAQFFLGLLDEKGEGVR